MTSKTSPTTTPTPAATTTPVQTTVCTPTWRLECQWTDWLDDENGTEISPNDWGEFELIEDHRQHHPTLCPTPRDIEVRNV